MDVLVIIAVCLCMYMCSLELRLLCDNACTQVWGYIHPRPSVKVRTGHQCSPPALSLISSRQGCSLGWLLRGLGASCLPAPNVGVISMHSHAGLASYIGVGDSYLIADWLLLSSESPPHPCVGWLNAITTAVLLSGEERTCVTEITWVKFWLCVPIGVLTLTSV